jgi:two-component system, cell cycle response regulator
MRILIADDEPVSRLLLQRTLERMGHGVVTVSDGTAAIAALLAPDGPRLAILDWMMPGTDGLAVCREVRQHAESYLYLILLTSRESVDDMVTGLEAGADDFLTKPFNESEMRARLRSGIRVLDLQAGLLAAQEALRQYATLDHLTGLWNRRMILEQLDREVNRVIRDRRTLTVAMLDIDSFKDINDRYGHATGDAVLRDVAAAIRTQLREYDFVGRYGGEEFILLLPGCESADGCMIANRVRTKISSEPVRYGDFVIPVTVSLGVASTGSVGLNGSELIEAADAALYRAKANGRDRVEEVTAKVA